MEVQLVQKTPEEIDLLIVPDEQRFRKEHLRNVLYEIHQRVGESVLINPKFVKKIPRSLQNKYRLTIRNFDIPTH